MKPMRLPSLVIVLCAVVLAGCAGERHRREAATLLAEGRTEEGLAALSRAVEVEPGNAEYRKEYLARRAAYLDQLLGAAQGFRRAGESAEAESAFRRVLAIEPSNPRARAGLDGVAADRRHAATVAAAREAYKAGDGERAQAMLRPVLSENGEHVAARALDREIGEEQARRRASEPTLKSSYAKPINLEIRDANVKMMFESLARTTGINFILDKDIRADLRTTVFLRNSSVEEAIDVIVQTSQLQKKVLGTNTVLIYPNTPEKQKEYQELVVKSFYLRNADAKQVQNTLKTLLKTRDLAIDEKLNLLIMRDTPDAIRIAERLVALQDLAEPEAMLDVEVLEVHRSRLTDLGIQWPGTLALTPLASGATLTVDDLRRLNGSRIGAAITDTTVNLRREVGNSNLLANPRIRVRNREKAKILIGDRVPVVTTTTTATGLVSDSVNYVDVGLKVDVEPDIHLQDEIAIRIGLEVSSIVKEIRSPSGTLAYRIGTRNASTVLRLKDGETQILAGLINDEERGSSTGIPGLADLPVLGRLFGSRTDDHQKTEIVLSITPRLIRNLERPDAAQGEFWSGTEASLRTRPMRVQPATEGTPATVEFRGTPTPAAAGDPAGAPGGGQAKSPPAANVALGWRGPEGVRPGEDFTLALTVHADGWLRGLPLQLGFDPAVVQVVDAVEGPFFRQNKGSSSFTRNVDTVGGRILVHAARTSFDGASGEDSVVFVTLRTIDARLPAEIRVLQATPEVIGGPPPAVSLPPPFVVQILR